jgi:Tfp pilus assembly protein PilN
MIEINLLQEERQKRASAFQRTDLTKPLVFIGLITLLAAAVLVNVSLALKVNGIKSQISKYKRMMTEIRHVESLKKADELQASLDKLNRKAVIIDDLITNRIHWSKKLSALRDSLPGDIWVERVELESPKTPKDTMQTLRIEAATAHADRGFARTAETMESLRNSADFMAGLTGELVDQQSTKEPWDPRGEEQNPADNIWRFSFVAKRQMPESELPQSAKKPAAKPAPSPTPAEKK